MSDEARDFEVQLIGDERGIAVIGNHDSVAHFLESKGLLHVAGKLSLHGLGTMLNNASLITEQLSAITENSSRYIKLTKESAKLRDELGLMPTKKDGISHVMLGKPGHVSNWLQAEEGPAAQLTNPAILTGVAGFLAQAARQQEAREVKELLAMMDQKLDDVRRGQRDAILSKIDRVSLALQQAMAIREHGGDVTTAWGKIEAESATIGEVQGAALRELHGLAKRASGEQRVGALAREARKIEQEAGVWIAVLARCFELQDELEILELDYVARSRPAQLEGHRQGLDENHADRRSTIAKKTTHLLDSLNKAGDIAAANILLHARAAQKTAAAINDLSAMIDNFYAPLGIETDRNVLTLTPWQAALRDREQLKTAGKEAGQKALVAGTAVGTVALALTSRNLGSRTTQ